MISAGVGRLPVHPNQDTAMTTFRHRMLVATLAILAAGLSACASDPTSPLDQPVSLDGDTTKKAPTIPWFDVNSAAPTIPWH